jgi:hypothetical protein
MLSAEKNEKHWSLLIADAPKMEVVSLDSLLQLSVGILAEVEYSCMFFLPRSAFALYRPLFCPFLFLFLVFVGDFVDLDSGVKVEKREKL